MTDGRFYFEVDCPKCEETLYEGVNLTLLEHNGLPSIPVDMASAVSVRCPGCRISVFVPQIYPDWESLDDDDEAGE
jgi:phage FluMu protein Com